MNQTFGHSPGLLDGSITWSTSRGHHGKAVLSCFGILGVGVCMLYRLYMMTAYDSLEV